MRLTGARRLGAIVGGLVMAAGVTVLTVGTFQPGGDAGASTAAPAVLGPGTVTVEIDIHHSRFSVARLRVHRHTTVEFVIVNHDPIGHEFIIGDAEVHARHASGHEASHPPVPGEVSIPPLRTGVTTFALHEPGDVEFACHLPGHLRYGMVGWVTVVDRGRAAR
jgi:uncharacterized cupredoxin-like copper-binding protein